MKRTSNTEPGRRSCVASIRAAVDHSCRAWLQRIERRLLAAAAALLDAMLAIVEAREAAGPLTARRVLRAARAHGVAAWTGSPERLLASIPGIDPSDPATRAQLLDLHRRGEIRLVRIEPIALAARELVYRGEPTDLIEDSALVEGNKTYHAVLVSAHRKGEP